MSNPLNPSHNPNEPNDLALNANQDAEKLLKAGKRTQAEQDRMDDAEDDENGEPNELEGSRAQRRLAARQAGNAKPYVSPFSAEARQGTTSTGPALAEGEAYGTVVGGAQPAAPTRGSKKTSDIDDSVTPLENLDINATLVRSEEFLRKNRNVILGVVGAIVLVVGGYLAYAKWWVPQQDAEAQSRIFRAELLLAKDSLDMALKGRPGQAGFLQVIDEFGGTPTGNLAHYYAGTIYMRQGKFQEAIDHLKKFDGKDRLIAPTALGLIGDAHMELKQMGEAMAYYQRAADASKNNLTTPKFLMRAAFVMEMEKDYQGAVENYKRVKRDFATTSYGQDADKYIARAEAKLGGNAK